jgi:MFS transporter, DHA2 family, multidrug resistance protein
MLASNTSLTSSTFRDSAASLGDQLRRAGVDQPQVQAYRRIYNSMQDQASTLSYIDTFWILGIATGIMFLLSFLLRKNNPGRAGAKALAH